MTATKNSGGNVCAALRLRAEDAAYTRRLRERGIYWG